MFGTPGLLMLWLILFHAPAVQNPQPKAWTILRNGMADSDAVKRSEAVTAASTIGATQEAFLMVEGGLKDPDPLVRQTAAAVLGTMKSRRPIPRLDHALDDPDPEVRLAAAKSLWELGDYKCRGVLMAILSGREKTSTSFVKQQVGMARREMHQPRTLARIGITQGAEAVLGPFGMGVGFAEDILKDDNAVGRSMAASLLASDSDPKSFEALEEALLDNNAGVRATAARALGQRGNPKAILDLEPMLDDKSLGPRLMSAAAIIRLERRSHRR